MCVSCVFLCRFLRAIFIQNIQKKKQVKVLTLFTSTASPLIILLLLLRSIVIRLPHFRIVEDNFIPFHVGLIEMTRALEPRSVAGGFHV